jgi:D-alanyl-D-alanine carboxypeptidase
MTGMISKYTKKRNRRAQKYVKTILLGTKTLLGFFIVVLVAFHILLVPHVQRLEAQELSVETLGQDDYMDLLRGVIAYHLIGQEAITASTVLVKDLESGQVLYEKNASAPRNLASLTKIVTGYTALKHAPSSFTPIQIDPLSLEAIGDQGLKIGDMFALSDAVAYTMATSSNDMAIALQNALPNFLELMRIESAEVGGITVMDPTGYDYRSQARASTARPDDILRMAEKYVQEYPVEAKKSTQSYPNLWVRNKQVSRTAPHSFKGIERLSHHDLALIKTGYTHLAGGNVLVIATINNRKVGIVIMDSTLEERHEDMIKVLDTTEFVYTILDTYASSQVSQGN